MSTLKQNPESPKLGRRTLLKGAASLAGGALLPSAVVAESKTALNGCSMIVSAGSGKAVVETTADKTATMVFDNKCEVKSDPDGLERRTVTMA